MKVATDFPYSHHSALLTGDAGSEYRRILSAPAGSPCSQDIQSPGIELELSSHDRPVDILHDGFDCVIRTGALPEDGVIARPLGKLTMVNCASPHYLTRFGYPLAALFY